MVEFFRPLPSSLPPLPAPSPKELKATLKYLEALNLSTKIGTAFREVCSEVTLSPKRDLQWQSAAKGITPQVVEGILLSKGKGPMERIDVLTALPLPEPMRAYLWSVGGSALPLERLSKELADTLPVLGAIIADSERALLWDHAVWGALAQAFSKHPSDSFHLPVALVVAKAPTPDGAIRQLVAVAHPAQKGSPERVPTSQPSVEVKPKETQGAHLVSSAASISGTKVVSRVTAPLFTSVLTVKNDKVSSLSTSSRVAPEPIPSPSETTSAPVPPLRVTPVPQVSATATSPLSLAEVTDTASQAPASSDKANLTTEQQRVLVEFLEEIEGLIERRDFHKTFVGMGVLAEPLSTSENRFAELAQIVTKKLHSEQRKSVLEALSQVGAKALSRCQPKPNVFHMVKNLEKAIRSGSAERVKTVGAMLERLTPSHWAVRRGHILAAVMAKDLSAISAALDARTSVAVSSLSSLPPPVGHPSPKPILPAGVPTHPEPETSLPPAALPKPAPAPATTYPASNPPPGWLIDPGLQLERWVLGSKTAEVTRFQALQHETRDAMAALLEACSALPTLATGRKLVDLLGSIAGQANGVLPELSFMVNGWAAALEIARTSYEAAKEKLAPDVLASLLEQQIDPEGLGHMAELLGETELWRCLPAWWWEHHGGPCESTQAALQTRLLHPEARRACRTLLVKIRAEDQSLPLTILPSIPPPDDGTDLADYIVSFLKNFALAQGSYQGPLWALLEKNALAVEALLVITGELDKVRPLVGEPVFLELVARAATKAPEGSDAVKDMISVFLAAVRSLQRKLQNLDIVKTFPIQSFDMEITQLGGAQGPSQPSPSRTPMKLANTRVSVPSSQKAHRNAPLVFQPTNGDLGCPHGTVSIPLLLSSSVTTDVLLTADSGEDTSRLRTEWPEQWGQKTPTLEPSELAVTSWRQAEKEHEADLELIVPIRRPLPSAKLSLRVRLLDRESHAPLTEWLDINDREFVEGAISVGQQPEIHLLWNTGEETEYARAHPVGPQVRLNDIEEAVLSGSSFLVTAPRRFGKSTLIALLEERLPEKHRCVVVRADCATFRRGESTEIDHRLLWEEVSRQLQEQLGAALSMQFDAFDPTLPLASAFEHVRAAAKRENKYAIVVLLDEAQLYFPPGAAGPFSARVRNLLTSSLRKTGNIPVVLGFVGLPSLSERRLGTNLYQLLRPLTHEQLSEEGLLKIIRAVTKGTLHTTADARQKIADSSGNLFILRVLLDRVRRYARDSYRVWVNTSDVLSVISTLKLELSRGEDREAMATYVRDALNESSSPEIWRPIASYAVAVAYATARGEGRSRQQAEDRTAQLLKEWSQRLFFGAMTYPTYTQEQISAHLSELRAFGILKHEDFASAFLGSYLQGVSPEKQNADLSSIEEALLRGGERLVRLPPSDQLEPVGEGAQSEVFRFKDTDGVMLAARLTPCETAEQRRQYLEAGPLVKALQKIHTNNRAWATHIFKLRDVGLHRSTDGRVSAVQIYDWVDGADLHERVLPPLAVVRIGLLLARALDVLHHDGILHRDIRPKNIVLQNGGMTPVLIDFGFARTATAPGSTPLNDELAAPWVQGGTPRWNTAADVYALAATLQVLLRGLPSQQAEQTRATLRPFCPASSPSTDETSRLIAALEDLERKFNHNEVCNEFLRKVLDSTTKAKLPETARNTLRRHIPELDGFALGLYRTPLERAQVVADLVNKMFEAQTKQSIAQLASAKWGQDITGHCPWPPGIQIVHQLRNAKSHGRSGLAELDRVVKKLLDHPKLPGPRTLGSAMAEGAETLANIYLGGSLHPVVEFLMSAGSGT